MIVRSCFSRRRPWPLFPSRLPIDLSRHFQASAGRNEMQDHYKTLDVNTDASQADIKKSFYKLSKANHPDLHPNDPSASQRFVKISEAYATLSSAEKRHRYDRDFLPQKPSASSRNPAYSGPTGSYSSAQSTGPGSRPASGLSRRRTTFRGPPPSFYRNGGWGDYGAKRQENANRASQTAEARGEAASGPQGPGMGPGGFTHGFDHDVSWFDQSGHKKTHAQLEEERRRRNRGRVRAERKHGSSHEDVGGGSTVWNFFVIGGILGGIATVTGVVSNGGTKAKSDAVR